MFAKIAVFSLLFVAAVNGARPDDTRTKPYNLIAARSGPTKRDRARPMPVGVWPVPQLAPSRRRGVALLPQRDGVPGGTSPQLRGLESESVGDSHIMVNRLRQLAIASHSGPSGDLSSGVSSERGSVSSRSYNHVVSRLEPSVSNPANELQALGNPDVTTSNAPAQVNDLAVRVSDRSISTDEALNTATRNINNLFHSDVGKREAAIHDTMNTIHDLVDNAVITLNWASSGSDKANELVTHVNQMTTDVENGHLSVNDFVKSVGGVIAAYLQ